jgi:hypothetical protein
MSTESNPFAMAAADQTALVQLAQSREAQQIQAALVVAKKFPRDQHAAFQRIIEACKRKGLAEEAVYLYSRGGQSITGASIRLLEVVAQQWGNFQCGIIELDNQDGESRVQAFAWDLETNANDSKTFTVRHERYTKTGGIVKLEDPRDQYEHVANFAARRKRACMEAVIPRDIIDAAIEQCDKTLKTGHTEPITDRVRKIVGAFAEFGVTPEMLERRLQHKLEAINEQELVILRKIYTSLKDGLGRREDFFDLTAAPKGAKFEEPKKPTNEEKKKEEAAEAAAGLAPAQTTTQPMGNVPAKQPAAAQTVTPPAAAATTPPVSEGPPPARGRKRSAMSAPPVDPTPPAAQAPVAATEPAQQAGGSGSAPAGELFGQSATSAPVNESQALAQKAYAALTEHSMTEAEVLQVFKDREICEATVEQLVQLSNETLADFVDPANTAMIASQVRINRRFAAGPKK